MPDSETPTSQQEATGVETETAGGAWNESNYSFGGAAIGVGAETATDKDALVQASNVSDSDESSNDYDECESSTNPAEEIAVWELFYENARADIPNPIPDVEKMPTLPLAATLAAARVSFAPPGLAFICMALSLLKESENQTCNIY